MLYFTSTMISSEALALYGVSRAQDWVAVDCGTTSIKCAYHVLYQRYDVFLQWKKVYHIESRSYGLDSVSIASDTTPSHRTILLTDLIAGWILIC